MHYLAAFALALGALLVAMMPPDAPIRRDARGGPKMAAMALGSPEDGCCRRCERLRAPVPSA